MPNPISAEEFTKRLAELCVNSRITAMPGRAQDRAVLFMSVILTLDRSREYSEAEINDELRFWLRDVAPTLQMDHVHLRRLLVDEGFLDRESAGSAYVPRVPAGWFEAEVGSTDVYRALGAAMRERQERKQRFAGR